MSDRGSGLEELKRGSGTPNLHGSSRRGFSKLDWGVTRVVGAAIQSMQGLTENSTTVRE